MKTRIKIKTYPDNFKVFIPQYKFIIIFWCNFYTYYIDGSEKNFIQFSNISECKAFIDKKLTRLVTTHNYEAYP